MPCHDSAKVDALILGQGLAGTCLAWTLIEQSQRVAIVDDAAAHSASRVAAGLITPITGPKLVKTWGWDDFWPAALDFYRKVEREFGEPLLQLHPAVRLFTGQQEREQAQRRIHEEETAELVQTACPSLSSAFVNDWGGWELSPAARLDVLAFLEKSRRWFLENGHDVISERIDPEEIEVLADGIRVPRLDISASRLYCCQGTRIDNRWFGSVQLKPAKGEMIDVHVPGPAENRVIHQRVWLCPRGEQTYRVGATFGWNRLDHEPTTEGLQELREKLEGVLRSPFEIVDHLAAVRPTVKDFRPVVGFSPRTPQVRVLNGLGTRGALMAPLLARLLTSPDQTRPVWISEVNVARWFR